jgi:hypothetical protein
MRNIIVFSSMIGCFFCCAILISVDKASSSESQAFWNCCFSLRTSECVVNSNLRKPQKKKMKTENWKLKTENNETADLGGFIFLACWSLEFFWNFFSSHFSCGFSLKLLWFWLFFPHEYGAVRSSSTLQDWSKERTKALAWAIGSFPTFETHQWFYMSCDAMMMRKSFTSRVLWTRCVISIQSIWVRAIDPLLIFFVVWTCQFVCLLVFSLDCSAVGENNFAVSQNLQSWCLLTLKAWIVENKNFCAEWEFVMCFMKKIKMLELISISQIAERSGVHGHDANDFVLGSGIARWQDGLPCSCASWAAGNFLNAGYADNQACCLLV